MGQIADIVLSDAESTPVVHTFKPSKQGLLTSGLSIAEFEDRVVNSGVAAGFYKINMSLNRPTKDRKTYRFEMKLSTPVLENVTNSTVSGIQPAPTVSYLPLGQVGFVLPERSALQVRKNLRKLFADLLDNAQVIAAIENLDFPY